MVVQKISTNEIVDTLNFNQWVTRKHSFYFFGRFGLVIEILTYRTSLSIFVEWQWILFDFSILVLKAIVDRVRRKSLHLIFKIAKPNMMCIVGNIKYWTSWIVFLSIYFYKYKMCKTNQGWWSSTLYIL